MQHPETLGAVVELAKKLVPAVLQSQETLDQVPLRPTVVTTGVALV